MQNLVEKRRVWVHQVMNGDAPEWVLLPDPVEVQDDQKCVMCGRWVVNGYVLQKDMGGGVILRKYVGMRCAITAMAYRTGGMK